jgi:prepilin peptidase dependent protein B
MLAAKPPRGRTRVTGVTLVELLIGLVIGTIIILAATATYISTSSTARATLNAAKLNAELRLTMGVFLDEVRRAGYSSAGRGTNNPLTAAGTDLREANGNCLEFAYDANDSGGVEPEEDFRAFHITNGLLRMRVGGSGPLAGCLDTDVVWATLSDATAVRILPNSEFSITYQCMNSVTNAAEVGRCIAGNDVFDNAAAGVGLLETRGVEITLAAELVGNPEMRMTLNQHVHVRNHLVTAK